ncbi:hypothetical protein [Paenisporosarcina cavernae]|uniref:Uncharacterized protein n=1 Tax=Paenisporosarcina cavernae TaxID=2320858 RepID=A0A385YST5_9BACL|nr:hypothetical protein [Paenisporosarcina cavernae]AYC29905.1 hypothetical protein D3873_08360 [Paenisporosarcina cavernae]
MLKTLKSKVIAGTVTVGMLSGVGVAFGASDAGDNLQTWFNNQFGIASDSIEDQSVAYVQGQVGALASEYNGLKTGAGASIQTAGVNATTTTNTNVSNKAGEYIQDVNDMKAHIDTYLAGEFDSLSNFAQGIINQAGTQALNYATTDLGTYTTAQGQTATTNMTTNINASTASTKADLQAAITAAKNDLQAQIDAETALTVQEIKDMIDAKIVQLRAQVTAVRDNYVTQQQAAITAAAQQLEASAIAELEAVVDGI